jgi:hypothetical protein
MELPCDSPFLPVALPSQPVPLPPSLNPSFLLCLPLSFYLPVPFVSLCFCPSGFCFFSLLRSCFLTLPHPEFPFSISLPYLHAVSPLCFHLFRTRALHFSIASFDFLLLSFPSLPPTTPPTQSSGSPNAPVSPRPPFPSPQNGRELSAHSAKELKAAAKILEVDIAGCFEKDDLVKAFKRANVASDQARGTEKERDRLTDRTDRKGGEGLCERGWRQAQSGLWA